MSWFKENLNLSLVNSTSTETDESNPYSSSVTEEFVRVPIAALPTPLTVPNEKAESHGSSTQSPNLPG